jgi:hypothetical protein
MTLIINEIHMLSGFNRTMLLFAADRRLSTLDGSFGALRPKLFRIPHLSGGVSYFGLAKVRNTYLSDWLAAFINKSAHLHTLRDFSVELRNELNMAMPADILRAHFSGFHICGYNQNGIPEFWFLTNIGGMENFQYTNLQPQYTEPSSDFLGRDAAALGWTASILTLWLTGLPFKPTGTAISVLTPPLGIDWMKYSKNS